MRLEPLDGWSEPDDGGRVRRRWRIESRGPVRLFRHGYQSWTPTGGGVVGVDRDLSLADGSIGLVRGMHHADAAVAAPDELRSELVTVLADDDGAVLLGFDGGARHDGTFRVRPGEVVAEACAVRAHDDLHALLVEEGEPAALLDRWARWAGEASGARTGAPFQAGWCSWYRFFHEVTERDVRENLAAAGDWPFDVFQVDDGYQRAIGDWLRTAETFPTPLDRLAADIAARGLVPGIWLAPFVVAPGVVDDSWIARRPSGRPVIGTVNPAWGDPVLTLDTTHPEVLAHLEETARTLVAMGWRYLKLDFTYAPSFDGVYHDPTRTPAERVRLGYDAIRRGAGDDVFLLGCGAPLGPCIGVVDGMRIGPDVAPLWGVDPDRWHPPGYAEGSPSVRNAWRDTLARSFQHRRLWLNDPDCLMLRTEGTRLTPAQVEAWALAVAASGGMAIVSDHLPDLGPDARRLLDEVLAIGRAVDAAAVEGAPPSCSDLLDTWTPTTLDGPVGRLVGDPDTGTATFSRR